MHGLTWIFLALIFMLQYPLWMAKGSWPKVWDLERQLEGQHIANQALQARNNRLAAEVRDLKVGYDALEERARYELGMIRQDEAFIQVMESHAPSLTEGTRP